MLELKKNYKLNFTLKQTNELTTAISWLMCFFVLIHWSCDFSIEYLLTQNLSETNTKNFYKSNMNNNSNFKSIIYNNFNIGSQRSAQIVYFFGFLHIILFIPFIILQRKTQTIFIAYFKTHFQLIIIILSMIIGKKLTPIFCSIIFIHLTMNKYFSEKG